MQRAAAPARAAQAFASTSRGASLSSSGRRPLGLARAKALPRPSQRRGQQQPALASLTSHPGEVRVGARGGAGLAPGGGRATTGR